MGENHWKMETQEGAEPMDWNQPFRPHISTRKKVAVFMPIRMVQTAEAPRATDMKRPMLA
ncbi:hypothetical protein D3C75_842740 [compost metagenome]